jgi:hypothetical protein
MEQQHDCKVNNHERHQDGATMKNDGKTSNENKNNGQKRNKE